MFIPKAPEGRVTLETVHSRGRGRDVTLFTAVPAGHGAGRGLPVVVVLHGVTGRPTDYRDFGLPRFTTAAVRAGAPPFVLVGADGGTLWLEPGHAKDDDPQRMVVEEMPRWIAARGFDATRLAGWGWSMGGYGVLRLAEANPAMLRAVAAFSPAVTPGDAVFAGLDSLVTPLGVWCGRQDPLYGDVRSFVSALPRPPRVASFADGAHTRVFWNGVTLPAFAFLGRAL